jgi:hypothetical protein
MSSSIVEEMRKGATFGTMDPRSAIGFATRFVLLIIPGIVLGHLLDQSVLAGQKKLKWTPLLCLTLQTGVWLAFFFGLYHLVPTYAWEFQNSYAGLAFVTLFFTVQTNYVANLQKVLRFTDARVGV